MRTEDVDAALSRMKAAYDAARLNPITGDASLDVYLADLPPDRARLVQDLSVPHWFDTRLVESLAPAVAADAEAVERFQSLPFVLLHPRGLRYHDSARTSLRQALVRTRPDRVREVSRVVLEILGEASDGESELERVYCMLAADPSTGAERLYELFHQARGGGDLSRCHSLLALADEQQPLLDERARTLVQYMQGLLQLEHHDYRQAAATLRELRSRSAGNGGLPKLELHIGMTLDAQSDWRASMKHYSATLKRLDRRSDGTSPSDALRARLYQRLAFAELAAGKLGKAEGHVRKSMKLNETTGDRYGLALNHELLGQINLKLGEPAAAETELRRSMEILEELGRFDTRARVLNHLASAHRVAGRHDEARHLYQQAIEAKRRYADSFEVANTELDRGALLHELGDTEAAIRCYLRALHIYDEFRHPVRQARALQRIAGLRYAQGKTDDAIAHLEQALTLVAHGDIARELRNDLRRYRRLPIKPPIGLLQKVWRWLLRRLGRLRRKRRS